MKTQKSHASVSFRPPVFVGSKVFRHQKNHLTSQDFFGDIPHKVSMTLGLNVDSEFQTQSEQAVFDVSQKAQARQIVTVQVSDLLNFYPSIFVHPDAVRYAQQTGRKNQLRHPCAQSEFIAVDYLKAQGFDAHMTYDDRALSSKRTLTITLCGFFLMVDLFAYFQGQCLSLIEEAILKKEIIHQRHFKFVPESGKGGKKNFRLPYFITIDGHRFGLVIDFLDLVGAQGKVSFKDFCQNVDMPLSSKDLAGSNISRMMEWYFENPADYEAYATGDLCLYPAWSQYAKNIQSLSAKIISPDYAVDPALTIGSTTNRILDGKRLQYLGLKHEKRRSDLFHRFLGNDTFKLLDDETNPAHTQLKVDGGRCHNNHPTLTRKTGALCDLDLKGAYTSAMMHVPTFFGTPSVISFEGQSLKKVLKKLKKRLLPYHWTMRVSTKHNLSFDQDVFPSYFDYKWKERKTDTESYHESGELDYESGKSKIFSRQIINGILTSDLLDLILHTWTSKAQQEFFSKTGVHSLLFYDPEQQEKDQKAFIYNVNMADFMEKTPSCWHSLPLKNLGIEDLREERKHHPKGTPMNILYKLLGNTAYGAIVSHFFTAQNPVTANNITAHIRVAVYLAEKSLGLYQTITDGGIFNLNEVLTPKRKGKIYTDKLFDDLTLSKKELNHKLDLKRAGLGGHVWRVSGNRSDNLSLFCDDALISLKDAEVLVNRLCLEHLKQTFPTMPLLQNPHLEFEMKAFFNKATFHGSSKYGFWQEDTLDAVKMRGYERKLHDGYGLTKQDQLVQIPTYDSSMSPAKWVHHEINQNPQAVRFPTPFIKNEILKTAAFTNLYSKRSKSPIKPGDNLKKMGIPKWLSLNQFTFQTKDQMDNWRKSSEQLLRRYGVSFELFYINEDSSLNYQEMTAGLHTLIGKGLGCQSKDEILQHFDPHRNRERIFIKHSILAKLKKAQEAMQERIADFYAVTGEHYQDTLETMQQDILDDEDQKDESSLK